MRCKQIKKIAWENGHVGLLEASAVRHLEGCASCRSYVEDLSTLQAGLSVLARDRAPEPSWGFSDRVLRRLKEEKGRKAAAPEFLESAGRRVILATLVLVLTLLLAMILPSSGPVRHETTVDSYWSQSETASSTAMSYPVDWDSIPPVPVVVEVRPVVYHGR
ncbi:MAG: anti-sigma factor family protein [Terriglobia bacterium]